MRRNHLVSSQLCSPGSAAACADAQKKWSTCFPFAVAARGPVTVRPGGSLVPALRSSHPPTDQPRHGSAYLSDKHPTPLLLDVQEESACHNKCVWGSSSREDETKGASPVSPMGRTQKAWIQQFFIKNSWGWLWISKVQKTNFFSN